MCINWSCSVYCSSTFSSSTSRSPICHRRNAVMDQCWFWPHSKPCNISTLHVYCIICARTNATINMFHLLHSICLLASASCKFFVYFVFCLCFMLHYLIILRFPILCFLAVSFLYLFFHHSNTSFSISLRFFLHSYILAPCVSAL